MYFVYILANTRPTLYIGVTDNLYRRVMEHREGKIEGFTQKYHIHKLVHYEITPYINDAIEREKQLKNWKRAWKLKLIKETNPTLTDLFDQITD
ncbi:hypothetical protein C5B42_00920 [Candidatus Cerribacteria bacterium 'Amazon FNV 2010 28 9']|uniref:GIY-YIG domain-containing protein n=1 Tax=Candidatus Cerribacteria bacterium 'Amazon FNV 2010 28 9' TaxID=2081795 RepID=A0A317JQE2_9BACT|nr:MAG: hypothetical protein C5B42_00920 [Candidatus Cerribacteria bacterium 'Amazon FNV 2010 28 9']